MTIDIKFNRITIIFNNVINNNTRIHECTFTLKNVCTHTRTYPSTPTRKCANTRICSCSDVYTVTYTLLIILFSQPKTYCVPESCLSKCNTVSDGSL